jgi:hypothetical protein
MDKELENLLDNYENAIYGKVFPITPSMHQLHLLLDYIANLEQQCKKQKEVIDRAIEYVEEHRIKNPYHYEYNCFMVNARASDLLEILKEVVIVGGL